jgi:hypothetical protein
VEGSGTVEKDTDPFTTAYNVGKPRPPVDRRQGLIEITSAESKVAMCCWVLRSPRGPIGGDKRARGQRSIVTAMPN